MREANIKIPVDLTNPGQFFACAGLLELASRLNEDAEGWFEARSFHLRCNSSFCDLVDALRQSRVVNAMSAAQNARLQELMSMSKKDREKAKLEDEKKALDALRREEPIVLESSLVLRIDWFRDEHSGGSRFKTWAGQQSVLDIATAMHTGLSSVDREIESTLWNSARGGGLPFNFDSDLGGQGSALDIGFSFDPLAANEATRIEGTCKPALEILAFIGLQRFRPREIPGRNRFVYVAWPQPLPPSVAAAVGCRAVSVGNAPCYEFGLLYRTKYLKSFLPAIPFQGDDHA
jgi:CRISPR-associated protein Csb3